MLTYTCDNCNLNIGQNNPGNERILKTADFSTAPKSKVRWNLEVKIHVFIPGRQKSEIHLCNTCVMEALEEGMDREKLR